MKSWMQPARWWLCAFACISHQWRHRPSQAKVCARNRILFMLFQSYSPPHTSPPPWSSAFNMVLFSLGENNFGIAGSMMLRRTQKSSQTCEVDLGSTMMWAWKMEEHPSAVLAWVQLESQRAGLQMGNLSHTHTRTHAQTLSLSFSFFLSLSLSLTRYIYICIFFQLLCLVFEYVKSHLYYNLSVFNLYLCTSAIYIYINVSIHLSHHWELATSPEGNLQDTDADYLRAFIEMHAQITELECALPSSLSSYSLCS